MLQDGAEAGEKGSGTASCPLVRFAECWQAAV